LPAASFAPYRSVTGTDGFVAATMGRVYTAEEIENLAG
jgi:hypothetical protein